MIKIVSKGIFFEDKIDEATELYRQLIPATRKEKGCIAYNLLQDINDNSIMTMIEEWESEECLKSHFESEHFKNLVPAISKLRKSSELNKYVVLL